MSQHIDGEEKVLAYYSRGFAKPERNYCVTRKELLAIVNSTKHFQKYLYGQKFLLRTDHAALRWLLNFKDLEGQMARWLERLQMYDFEIVHRKGTTHSNADALSRRPCLPGCKYCCRHEEKIQSEDIKAITISADDGWTATDLADAQSADEDLQHLITWKKEGKRPDWQSISEYSAVLKSYWAQWDSLYLEGDLLKRKWESADGSKHRMQTVIPRSRTTEILDEMHGGPSGGHLGVNKTLDKTRERFYWLHVREDVESWCRRCNTCASVKGPKRRLKGAMQIYNVGVPFERIAIEISSHNCLVKCASCWV